MRRRTAGFRLSAGHSFRVTPENEDTVPPQVVLVFRSCEEPGSPWSSSFSGVWRGLHASGECAFDRNAGLSSTCGARHRLRSGSFARGAYRRRLGQARPMRYERETAALGGIARRSDLRRMGIDDQAVRIFIVHGGLLRVRQAWYALPDTHVDAVRACEIGGRLACASALRFHGEPVADDGVLHVEMPANAVAREPRYAWGIVRLHWPRHASRGNRAVVDAEAAWRQWERCGVAGPRGIRSTR